MSRNRNKKTRYRIGTGGAPVSEVLLEVEDVDEGVETPDPTPAPPQADAALGKGAGLAPSPDSGAPSGAADGEPTEVADFHVFFPITKVDAVRREVWGRGAQEVPDASGEILDWATSKPFIRAWSEDAFKRSGGKSKGNIRAMHQPIAAGRLLDLQLVDAEKAVDLGSEIVDDQEWRKVEKGVYTGYSIGGKYVKRWIDPLNPSLMRYTARPTEFSLVDVPAIPTATFTLVKADGTEELRKFESVLADADAPTFTVTGGGTVETLRVTNMTTGETHILAKDLPAPATAPSTTTLADSKIANLPAQPAPFAVTPADPPAGNVIAAQANPGRADLSGPAAQAQSATPTAGAGPAVAKTEADPLTARGQTVGIARRADAPLAPGAGQSGDWKNYADPANWGWACDEGERAEKSVTGYNAGAGKERYSIQEWAVLGRRIARLAGAVGSHIYKYDPGNKRIRRVQPKEANKMAAPTVMDLVGQARTLLSSIPGSDAVDQALSIMDVIADTAGSGVSATAGTPSTVTPTPTVTGTGSTLAAAAPPASPSLPPNVNSPAVANSTPGPSTTGDNSPSAPDPKTPSTSVPTSPTPATKGADMTAAPAAENTGEVFDTNPPQAGLQVFAMEGDGRLRAKLPEFTNALVNGGRKAIEKAFLVAEKDQQFFDELYNAAMRKVLDDGKINYDNRSMLNKAEIFGTRGLGAGEEAELRKGVSSSFAPGIYLQRLVKLMLPIVTPVRNRMFTEQAPLGAATAQWRAQLGFTNFIYAAAMSVAEAGVTIGSTTGTGQTINESSLTFASPFASTPNSNVVSLQAIAAGRGYDDPLQIAVIQSLTAMLKTEECNLLYMSNASIAMSAVTAASAATGSLSAGSYTFKITALTGQGWRYTQDIPSYAGASTYSVGGQSFATAGETAVTSSGSFFVAASGKATATWPAVKGAVAYNVYLNNATNEYWQATVTVPSVTISALATTGSSGPAANTTANTNGYEGLVSWAELATVYGQAIPTKSFTDQAGAALTLAASNSIKEFDTLLKNLWVNWNIAPTLILCSPQSALHANAVIASGSAGFSNYRIEATNVQGQIVGGLMQTGYTNKFANYTENMQRVVDILAHPYMPDGTFLFLSEMINYRMARETRGFKVETRIPYTYFPLGPTAPHYPFTVLVDETLECFHPSGQAAIAGVNVS